MAVRGRALTAEQRLGDVPTTTVAEVLRTTGLHLDLGLASVRLHADVPGLASALRAVYRHFPWRQAGSSWSDITVRLLGQRQRWPWSRGPATFRLHVDGQPIFDPFPAGIALPMLEWGCNYLLAQRMNHVLLLHAGVVERDGAALVLPALPGSGKSTLTAALALSGWRLLSDEFGAFDPEEGAFRAVLKPVGLKNASIDVIGSRFAHAELGPSHPNTRKGTVAHLAPPEDAVARVQQTAEAGVVVLARWQAGASTRIEPVAEQATFSSLAFNAFNYETCGVLGFRAALHLVRTCPAWQLVYSDLDDALATLDRVWRSRRWERRHPAGLLVDDEPR